jgi:Heterokaryon incompatibility protein (HET)
MNNYTSVELPSRPSTVSSLPAYHYTPLPADHIRLLHIIRADEKIHCSLSTAPLDKLPEFYAISYCWGTDAHTSTIACDGGSLHVTPHLYTGLQCIFELAESKSVWIDAICINQADDAEKAAQVARMWTIYGAATRVMVWLGPEEDDSDRAVDAIPDLCDKFAKIPKDTKLIKNPPAFGLPPFKDRVWTAVQQVYRRAWFQRLWIVQEAVLAQDLYLVCGTKPFTWDQLSALTVALQRHGITMRWEAVASRQARDAMEMVRNVDQVHRKLKDGYVSAALLLHISRSQATREPIDRVYGILGVLTPDIREQTRVDYSPESREAYGRTYMQLFRSLLIEEGPKMLIVLSSLTRNPDLPSWCPDLSSSMGTASIPYFGDTAGKHEDLGAVDVERIRPGEGEEVIIPGLLADTVVDSTPLTEINHWNGMPSGIPLHLSCMARAEERARQVLERMPRPASEAEYARTLIANHDWRRKCQYVPQGRIEEDSASTLENIRANDRAFASGQDPIPAPCGPYLTSLHPIWDGRTFFATENGRVGVGPRVLQPSDRVAVIFSGYCPYILRRQPGTNAYHILGDAYVDGLMKGEVFDTADIKKNGYERFRIV